MRLLSRKFREADVKWICQKCGNKVSEEQKRYAGCHQRLYLVIVELKEQVAQRLVSLIRLSSRAVVGPPLLHEVNDLWHGVLLYRLVLDICRYVIQGQ